VRYLAQFGRFLYDFLVGDAWELAAGPIIALLVAWALVQAGFGAGVIGGVLFVAVLVVAALHLTLALRHSA
jgi:hypothetical protein